MSDGSIHVYLKVGVPTDLKPGFKELMQELVAQAQTEPGTLMYEWFFCSEERTCHIQERYANAEEGEKHVKNFAGRFFEHIDGIEGVVSANASPYIRSVMDGISPVYATKAAGFNRF